MYNFLEYSKNYRKATESLWNYYRDEPSNPLSSNSESFKYKTSITGITYNVGEVKLIMMEIKLVKIKLKLLLLFLFYQNDIHVFTNNIYNTIKKVHIYKTWQYHNCTLVLIISIGVKNKQKKSNISQLKGVGHWIFQNLKYTW